MQANYTNMEATVGFYILYDIQMGHIMHTHPIF